MKILVKTILLLSLIISGCYRDTPPQAQVLQQQEQTSRPQVQVLQQQEQTPRPQSQVLQQQTQAPRPQVQALQQQAQTEQSIPSAPGFSDSAKTSKQHMTAIEKQVKGIMPVRLKIPTIGLNSVVEPVGVLQNGQMGVPTKYDRVGILTPWTKPGEKGNAVMAGHFDHYTGPAVFYGLRKLKPGDDIYVSNRSGTELRFRVSQVESYETAKAPLEQIFNQSGDIPQLNLITCAGKFKKKTQEHSRRLVVFSKLVTEEQSVLNESKKQ